MKFPKATSPRSGSAPDQSCLLKRLLRPNVTCGPFLELLGALVVLRWVGLCEFSLGRFESGKLHKCLARTLESAPGRSSRPLCRDPFEVRLETRLRCMQLLGDVRPQVTLCSAVLGLRERREAEREGVSHG